MPLSRQALSDVVEQLRRTPVGLDTTLGRTVYYGVAYHHAGMFVISCGLRSSLGMSAIYGHISRVKIISGNQMS